MITAIDRITSKPTAKYVINNITELENMSLRFGPVRNNHTHNRLFRQFLALIISVDKIYASVNVSGSCMIFSSFFSRNSLVKLALHITSLE